MEMNLQECSLTMKEDENNFVILSRRLRKDGDTAHAERLLKNGLQRVESNLQNEELALLEILQELISIYSEQGRLDERNVLSKRIDELSETDFFKHHCGGFGEKKGKSESS